MDLCFVTILNLDAACIEKRVELIKNSVSVLEKLNWIELNKISVSCNHGI